MTAPAPEALEQRRKVPPLKHAHCPGCYPAGGQVPTMCGEMKHAPPRRGTVGGIPVEACVVCAAMVFVPCVKCGWHW